MSEIKTGPVKLGDVQPGDIVHCRIYGNGVVTKVRPENFMPISVKFLYGNVYRFTKDGRHLPDGEIALFHGHQTTNQ